MAGAAAILLYSTHPDLAQARASATALLDAGLAACCNILPMHEAHYRWNGARETAQEIAMLSKTTVACAEPAIALLQRLHSYDCPAIIALPIEGGNSNFLQWVTSQCRLAPPPSPQESATPRS